MVDLFDRALSGGVRMIAGRYGLEEAAANGAITRCSLAALLEVVPPPHQGFVEAHQDYYRRRFVVLGREGAQAALVVWSLQEPLVWVSGISGVPDLERLPWVHHKPLQENFRSPPLLTLGEAIRQVQCILKAEGFTPREEPVLLPPDPEAIAAAVVPRLQLIAQGRGLEGTARLLVERNMARWEKEGEQPQAVAVVDVGGPIPAMLAFDDPRPLVWMQVAA
ncbi:MAG: hypothetical protein KatS3mg071_1895 [Meiothermus sp.]|nr:MAG: hypothetical protein KatS3mg071_1895 [Meiothermus sp.]